MLKNDEFYTATCTVQKTGEKRDNKTSLKKIIISMPQKMGRNIPLKPDNKILLKSKRYRKFRKLGGKAITIHSQEIHY